LEVRSSNRRPIRRGEGWASSARPGGLGQRSSCARNVNAEGKRWVADATEHLVPPTRCQALTVRGRDWTERKVADEHDSFGAEEPAWDRSAGPRRISSSDRAWNRWAFRTSAEPAQGCWDYASGSSDWKGRWLEVGLHVTLRDGFRRSPIDLGDPPVVALGATVVRRRECRDSRDRLPLL
jgi:hypothetical protein